MTFGEACPPGQVWFEAPTCPPEYSCAVSLPSRCVAATTVVQGAISPGGTPIISAPSAAKPLNTTHVVVGAGVGFLARGLTGAIVGGLLGMLWR